MRKFFIVLALAAVLVPVLSFPAVAVEFDLPTPEKYNRPIISSTPDDYKYANRYKLYIDTDSNFDFLRYDSFVYGLHYYKNQNIVWGLGSYYAENVTQYHITLDPWDKSLDYYRFSTPNIDVSDSLCFVSLLYPDIIIPAQADNYLKVTFYMNTNYDTNNMDWSSYPGGYKQFVDEYTKAQYLCGFVYRTPESGFEWSLPTSHMVPSAVTVKDVGSTITNKLFVGDNIQFTYYFNISGGFLSDLINYEGVGLLIRFPFWFGSNASNGVRILGNADLPSTYEIISPNDYSQDLENIQNAVSTVNTSILQVYDALTNNPDSACDTIIITGFKANTDKLDSTVGDYSEAQSKVDKIVSNVTLPSVTLASPDVMQDIGVGEFSQNTDIWNSYTVAMVAVAFSFATISLILYGKKGSGS